MPSENLSHRVIRNANLPYVSNLSPETTDPCFVPGSLDLLTSIKGYSQRRPGWGATPESSATTFNNPQRTFTWDRTDGTFYLMICDVNASNQAVVYKFQFGVDTSASAIYTDTGSATPFDFGVSNNTLYFSNGHVAKKWDPINGVTNWGISIGSVNNATGPNAAGAGASVGSGTAWSSPSSVTGSTTYASQTRSLVGTYQLLNATTFSFSITAGTTITGIKVTFDCYTSIARAVLVQLLKGGSAVGNFQTVTTTTTPGTNVSAGGPGDTWGNSFTANDINQANFGVQFTAENGGGTMTTNIRNVQITIFGIGGPSVSKVGSGGFTAYQGYEYVFTYGNSNSGHISSPSPVSASTGSFGGAISTTSLAVGGSGYAANDTGVITAGNFNGTYTINTVTGGAVVTYTITANGTGYPVLNNVGTAVGGTQPGAGKGFTINITAVTGIDHVQVNLTASTDPQVNQIHVYRSTDSAPPGITAGTFFELPNSPFANTTANISDNAADTALIVANIAPTPTFNDPPTPGQCVVYFSGRFWMLSGNKVWFSGLEETIVGVPEESWPSGIAGNFWSFDQTVQALGVAGSGTEQTLIIFCAGRVYGITGNSLDTFRRFIISNNRGCRNIKSVTTMGGMVAWRDTSGQVWATDGSNTQELAVPIRPDLAPYTPGSDSMAFFASGPFHWLLVSTGTQVFVYDLDTEQWMPPWSHASNHLRAGESSGGVYQLYSCDTTNLVTQLTTVNANFDLSSAQAQVFYTPTIQTSFTAMVPDFGTRFSYAAAGFYDEPSKAGTPWYFQIDTDTSTVGDVQFMVDDDPLNAATTYTSIAANSTNPGTAWNRGQGLRLVQNVYAMTKPVGRWISWIIKGSLANDNFKVYSWFTTYTSK